MVQARSTRTAHADRDRIYTQNRKHTKGSHITMVKSHPHSCRCGTTRRPHTYTGTKCSATQRQRARALTLKSYISGQSNTRDNMHRRT